MAEPKIGTIMPGETLTIRWIPAADEMFTERNKQNDTKEYRLELVFTEDPRLSGRTSVYSAPFAIR